MVSVFFDPKKNNFNSKKRELFQKVLNLFAIGNHLISSP